MKFILSLLICSHCVHKKFNTWRLMGPKRPEKNKLKSTKKSLISKDSMNCLKCSTTQKSTFQNKSKNWPKSSTSRWTFHILYKNSPKTNKILKMSPAFNNWEMRENKSMIWGRKFCLTVKSHWQKNWLNFTIAKSTIVFDWISCQEISTCIKTINCSNLLRKRVSTRHRPI